MSNSNNSTKTFHRWTKDEDARLLAAVDADRSAYESIGQPGGVARDLFWGQIPGRIGVLATPLACQMRHRTLTSETAWARKRRTKNGKAPHDETSSLRREIAELKQLVRRALESRAA